MLVALAFSCLFVRGAVPSERASEAYRRCDWFALREAVRSNPDPFYRAVVANRFNRWSESTQLMQEYLRHTSPNDEHRADAYDTLADNERKQGHYRAAADYYDDALRLTPPKDRASVQTSRDLFFALRDVAPCSASGKACSVRLPNVGGGRRLPVSIGSSQANFLVDTGANLSLVSSTVAKRLGMRLIPTTIQIGTVTEAKVKMSLATLPEIRVGEMVVRNPVFLVLDEAASSIPMETLQISGIIGLPVLMALGELTFSHDGTVHIDPRGRLSNGELCLDGLKPVIRATVNGRSDPYLLDSGASRTDFYSPFFRAFTDQIRRDATKITHRITGVGGGTSVSGWSLPTVNLDLPGGAHVELPNARVYSNPLREDDRYYFGNLGQDILDRCESFTINFRACGMSFKGSGTGNRRT